MRANRRTFLIWGGATVAGLSAGSSVVATEHTPLYFETVALEGDFVVIGNAGDEDFDLSGYVIDWEYGQQEDQTDEIPEGIVVPAGGTVKLASGYDEDAAADADHDFGYDAGRIRDDGTDTIAIHEPEMDSLVITSDDHQDPPEDSNGNGDGGDGDDEIDEDGNDGDDGGDDGDGSDDGTDEGGDDGGVTDDEDGEDDDDRELESDEQEEVEDDDCPEEEREEKEEDDDDCPEEEPEPEPKEDDCP